jgi:DNA-3-methyladenine glycosylase II
MHCPKALVPAPMATFARYNKSVAFLRKIDHDWADLVARVGPCRHDPKAAREPYEALVRAIGYQQLTAKAGDAMIGRLKALHPDAAFPTPEHILRSDFDALRACGFSATKIATIKAIADGALSGQVPTRGDAVVTEDEELVERITKIKGIGRWSVEMLLMYSLERMDILPVDDFGVRDGYRKLKNLAELPKPNKLRGIGKDWAPHRTVASWYLWRIPRDRDSVSKRSAESKQAGPKRR